MPDSDDGGVITAARLQLALVLIVVARWSTDLDVIYIISSIHCVGERSNFKKIPTHTQDYGDA